jgi:hypothetical protein
VKNPTICESDNVGMMWWQGHGTQLPAFFLILDTAERAVRNHVPSTGFLALLFARWRALVGETQTTDSFFPSVPSASGRCVRQLDGFDGERSGGRFREQT